MQGREADGRVSQVSILGELSASSCGLGPLAQGPRVGWNSAGRNLAHPDVCQQHTHTPVSSENLAGAAPSLAGSPALGAAAPELGIFHKPLGFQRWFQFPGEA